MNCYKSFVKFGNIRVIKAKPSESLIKLYDY
jgi:hypothetical protein